VQRTQRRQRPVVGHHTPAGLVLEGSAGGVPGTAVLWVGPTGSVAVRGLGHGGCGSQVAPEALGARRPCTRGARVPPNRRRATQGLAGSGIPCATGRCPAQLVLKKRGAL
jgi:hypothetical protein